MLDGVSSEKLERDGRVLQQNWYQYILRNEGVEQRRGSAGGYFGGVSIGQIENQYTNWNAECQIYLRGLGLDLSFLFTSIDREIGHCLSDPLAGDHPIRFPEMIEQQMTLVRNVPTGTSAIPKRQETILASILEALKRGRKVATWQLIIATVAAMAAISYYLLSTLR